MKEEEAWDIFKAILNVIDYCHNQNIVHRDIKMENILVDPNTHQIKIIDFGFSLKLSSLSNVVTNYCGTPAYMSPEIVKKIPHQPHYSDIWALGILLFVMLTGKFPFRGSSELELY